MEQIVSTMREKRPYDATRRQAQAQRTQTQVLAVARRRFLADGYAATSIGAIAAESGASVETIYKAFGGKARLVKAIFDAGLAGEEPQPTTEVANRLSAEEPDPPTRLRAFGALVAAIGPRVAHLALLVRDAASSDAELAAVWEQLNQERLARMAAHAEHLHRDGALRPGLSVEEARDVLWAFCSPELYDLLVLRQGWNVERFGRWVGEAYVALLLPPLADQS
jgi:AcrR family transcriptional regulator